MTESEISEIRTAIALIHHLTDDDPLTGWKYDMLKAVLPLLEDSVNESLGRHAYIQKQALSIARVVNYKRPNTTTICDLEVKEDRLRPFKITGNDLMNAAISSQKAATVSNATLKRLQAEGRIKEKPQTPIVVRRDGVDYLSSKEIEQGRIKEKK